MSGLFVKLDVEYASDDKMIEAGPMAELLYVRGLTHCKKNPDKDGFISDAQLAGIALRIPAATKVAQRLVEVGAWTKFEKGWVVTAWLKRNRSGSDIKAQTDMASALGQQGNHERWHVGPEGKPSPKCQLCIGLHHQTPSGRGSGTPIGGSSPEEEERRTEENRTEPEVEPEVEPEPEVEQSLNGSSSVDKRVLQSRVTETGPRSLTSNLTQLLGEKP